MPLKDMVYEFAYENIELTFESGDAFDILNRIGKDGEWAMFEDVFLTANMLQRDIHVYLREYPAGECYRFSP